jgi:hypothetical protein
MIGEVSGIKHYQIQVCGDNNKWVTVYKGNEIISGEKKYIHGASEVKGSKLRIVFTEITAAIEIYEMKLLPYINWAREDTNAAVYSENNTKEDLSSIINGNRIQPGWITIGGQSFVLQFEHPHRIDTVTVVGLQESVKEGGVGEIPNQDMMSGYVQRQYTLSYLNHLGEWVLSASYITMPDKKEDELLRKVLNQFVLESPVVTTGIRVEIGTSYWVRVIELEAAESFTI